MDSQEPHLYLLGVKSPLCSLWSWEGGVSVLRRLREDSGVSIPLGFQSARSDGRAEAIEVAREDARLGGRDSNAGQWLGIVLRWWAIKLGLSLDSGLPWAICIDSNLRSIAFILASGANCRSSWAAVAREATLPPLRCASNSGRSLDNCLPSANSIEYNLSSSMAILASSTSCRSSWVLPWGRTSCYALGIYLRATWYSAPGLEAMFLSDDTRKFAVTPI
jgi:hypothetical protein